MSNLNSIENGEYIITNVGHSNIVILPDANGGTPLSAHYKRDKPEEKVYTSQRSSFTPIPKRVCLVVH
jgi:hypothetical protein